MGLRADNGSRNLWSEEKPDPTRQHELSSLPVFAESFKFIDFFRLLPLRPTVLTSRFVQKMSLTNCGLHGVKLSTFVRGVTIRYVTISAPRGSGIEVRGGSDLSISDNVILGTGDTAIRLGGGARNVVVQRNLIKWVRCATGRWAHQAEDCSGYGNPERTRSRRGLGG